MQQYLFLRRIITSLTVAALASVWMTTAGFAQYGPTSTGQSGGQYVLLIQSPQDGSGASGALTVTGTAVDCATGQAATRVAVYDGPNLVSSAYLADVSMERTEDIATYCAGRSGTDKIGFTLIYDTTPLADGGHNLTFMAQYTSGGSQTAGFNVYAHNQSPYAQSCGYQSNCDGSFYYGNDYLYGNGGNYGGNYYGSDYLYNNNDNYNSGYLYNTGGLYSPAPLYAPGTLYSPGVTVNGLGTQSVQCVSFDMAGNCLGYQNVGVNTGTIQCAAYNTAGQCVSYQNVGVNNGTAQCAAYNAAGYCLSYQNVGTAGLQCVSFDVGGNCLAYGNSQVGGAIVGGVAGNCVLTSQGTCLQTGTTTGQSILPCPGNPMARCLLDGSGGYTVIP